jgi:hypothetical protein
VKHAREFSMAHSFTCGFTIALGLVMAAEGNSGAYLQFGLATVAGVFALVNYSSKEKP